MEFSLFEASNGECPYLEGKEWISYLIQSRQLDPYTYENLLNQGFRRSGSIFYKNNCQDCTECVSLRVHIGDFSPSKSQRRLLKKNEDLVISKIPSAFDEEAFALYVKFTSERYNNPGSEEEFRNFLSNAAFNTWMMRYELDGKLIGIGWVDILVNSISSVYFAFDPDYKDRSLGTFSVLKELELCKNLSLDYLHLGFWVQDCQAMSYKNRFRPYELLVQGNWVRPEGKVE